MRAQTLSAIGTLWVFLTVVAAVPTLKYSRVGNCGVTTVYVIVTPTESSSNLSQLSNTTLGNYSLVVHSDSTSKFETGIAELSALKSTTYFVSTEHETFFSTRTATDARTTGTETIQVTYAALSTLPVEHTHFTNTSGIGGTSSADALISSSLSINRDSDVTISYGSWAYQILTMSVRPTCPDGLVICPETSVLNSVVSSVTRDSATSKLTVPTPPPSLVYVVETLTVIPLATLPSVADSIDETTTITVHRTTTTVAVTRTEEQHVSTPSAISYIDKTSLSSAGFFTQYSRKPGVGGWNISISSTSDNVDTSSLGSTVAGFDTISTVNAFSRDAPTASTYPSVSINFSHCSSLLNTTSNLVAQSGFTALHISSTPFTTTRNIFSNGLQFHTSTSLQLAQSSSEAAWTELSFSETDIVTSTIDALQSTAPSLIQGFITAVSAPSSITSEASLVTPTPSGSSTLDLSTPKPETRTTLFWGFSAVNSSESPSSIAPISTSSLLSDSVTRPSSEHSITATPSILTFVTLTSSSSISTFISGNSANSINALSDIVTSSSSALLPNPTSCGEQRDFILNFDDLPPLSVFDNSTAQPMPLFSPYHKFFFSDGFRVVPPPTDPYLPSSGRLLVEFLADPSSALGTTGGVSTGPANILDCFNFNALGMSLGCDSKGPDCDWQFTGFRYNNISRSTDQITTQNISTAACPSLSKCSLVRVSLDSTFENLTELRIHVTIGGEDKIWWMDDLSLSWRHNSCAAQLCRQKHV